MCWVEEPHSFRNHFQNEKCYLYRGTPLLARGTLYLTDENALRDVLGAACG